MTQPEQIITFLFLAGIALGLMLAWQLGSIIFKLPGLIEAKTDEARVRTRLDLARTKIFERVVRKHERDDART